MAEVQIQSVRIRHSAIMDFMLANPTIPQGRIAEHFKVTEPWLSVVINSDAFQAELHRRQEKLFDQVVVPLRQQVEGVARKALEHLETTLDQKHVEPEFALKVADKTLQRLMPTGTTGASAVANTQVNYYQVNPDVLKEARAIVQQTKGEITVEQQAGSGEVRDGGMLDFRSSSVSEEEDS